MLRTSGLLGALLISTTTALSAQAQNASLHANIELSLRGIGIGTLKHGITVSGDTYRVSGDVKTNTLISLVADTSASISASGMIKDNRVIPVAHALEHARGSKKGFTRINFSKNMVKKVKAHKPIKYKPTAIKVTDSHLKRVVDPVSALVVSVKKGEEENGNAICKRRIRIFDGKERYDVALSYVGVKKEKTDGFSGNVFTCKARYIPVAGHRPEKENVQKLQANDTIRVSLARVGDTSVYALYGFEATTQAGRASGKASKFKLQ